MLKGNQILKQQSSSWSTKRDFSGWVLKIRYDFSFCFLQKMMECKSGEWNDFFSGLTSFVTKQNFCQIFLVCLPLQLQIYFQFESWFLWEFQASDFNSRIKEMEINILSGCWHMNCKKSHFKSNEYFDIYYAAFDTCFLLHKKVRHRPRKGTKDMGRKPVKSPYNGRLKKFKSTEG